MIYRANEGRVVVVDGTRYFLKEDDRYDDRDRTSKMLVERFPQFFHADNVTTK